MVLSTNVAEKSITIDDVVVVIDTGRCRETAFNPSTGLSRLADAWISRASARQRRGRAGRVRPGVCFRLYSRQTAAEMAPHQEPEMNRVPLDQICLQVLRDAAYVGWEGTYSSRDRALRSREGREAAGGNPRHTSLNDTLISQESFNHLLRLVVVIGAMYSRHRSDEMRRATVCSVKNALIK